jgi:hypothetical protein
MQPDGNTYDHPARRWIYERHRIGTNGEQSWKRPRFTVDCIANRRRRKGGRKEGRKKVVCLDRNTIESITSYIFFRENYWKTTVQ